MPDEFPLMEKSRYVELQQHLTTMCTLAAGFDVEEIDLFLSTLDRSLALAPFVDPTLFMRGRDRAHDVQDTMRALRQFVAAVRGVAERQAVARG